MIFYFSYNIFTENTKKVNDCANDLQSINRKTN